MSLLNDINRAWNRFNFNARARIRVYDKIATMLRSEQGLETALQRIYFQESKRGRKPTMPLAQIATDLLTKVRQGKPFHEAIAPWVPHSEAMLIEAGAADLPAALDNIVFIVKEFTKVRVKAKRLMRQPKLLFMASIGMLIAMALWVFPRFEMTLPKDQWEGPAAGMAWLSDLLLAHWPIMLVVFLSLWGGLRWSMNHLTGSLRVGLDRWPPWSIHRTLNGVSFLLSLSSFLKQGTTMADTLAAMKTNASPWLLERLQATLDLVRSGAHRGNLGSILIQTGFGFPSEEICDDLEVYCQADNFEEILERQAKEWLERAIDVIEDQAGILRGIATILVSVVIAWGFAGMMLLAMQMSEKMGAGYGM